MSASQFSLELFHTEPTFTKHLSITSHIPIPSSMYPTIQQPNQLSNYPFDGQLIAMTFHYISPSPLHPTEHDIYYNKMHIPSSCSQEQCTLTSGEMELLEVSECFGTANSIKYR